MIALSAVYGPLDLRGEHSNALVNADHATRTPISGPSTQGDLLRDRGAEGARDIVQTRFQVDV